MIRISNIDYQLDHLFYIILGGLILINFNFDADSGMADSIFTTAAAAAQARMMGEDDGMHALSDTEEAQARKDALNDIDNDSDGSEDSDAGEKIKASEIRRLERNSKKAAGNLKKGTAAGRALRCGSRSSAARAEAAEEGSIRDSGLSEEGARSEEGDGSGSDISRNSSRES